MIVNLTSGEAFKGQMALSWPWNWRVRHAVMINLNGEQRGVDGTVTIPRSSVKFVQVIG